MGLEDASQGVLARTLSVRGALRSLGEQLAPLLDGTAEGVMATGLYLDQYRLPHEALRVRAPKGAALLDWGTGIGHFAYVQALQGRRVTAFGLGDDAVSELLPCAEALGRTGGFQVVRSNDPIKLPFADGSFDVVVSCGVLEHVRETGGNEIASLEEIRRVLRRDGTFACAHFPNVSSWIERVNRGLGRQHHRFVYSAEDIRVLAAKAGFDVILQERYGMLPRISVARRLGRLASWPLVQEIYHTADQVAVRIAGAFAQNHFFMLTPSRSDPTA